MYKLLKQQSGKLTMKKNYKLDNIFLWADININLL